MPRRTEASRARYYSMQNAIQRSQYDQEHIDKKTDYPYIKSIRKSSSRYDKIIKKATSSKFGDLIPGIKSFFANQKLETTVAKTVKGKTEFTQVTKKVSDKKIFKEGSDFIESQQRRIKGAENVLKQHEKNIKIHREWSRIQSSSKPDGRTVLEYAKDTGQKYKTNIYKDKSILAKRGVDPESIVTTGQKYGLEKTIVKRNKLLLRYAGKESFQKAVDSQLRRQVMVAKMLDIPGKIIPKPISNFLESVGSRFVTVAQRIPFVSDLVGKTAKELEVTNKLSKLKIKEAISSFSKSHIGSPLKGSDPARAASATLAKYELAKTIGSINSNRLLRARNATIGLAATAAGVFIGYQGIKAARDFLLNTGNVRQPQVLTSRTFTAKGDKHENISEAEKAKRIREGLLKSEKFKAYVHKRELQAKQKSRLKKSKSKAM